MLRSVCMFAVLASAGCLMLSGSTADEKKTSEKPALTEKKAERPFKAKCPVSGADAKKEQATAYKEKEVYFCCEKCKGAFEADNSKFVVKANHQLVQTRQFRQTKCPFSGGNLNKEMTTKVNGVNVQFCCDKCKAKADAASADEKLAMIFSEDAFKKGFKARKADDKAGKKSAE